MTKPEWASPRHSRTRVDRAGETLIDASSSASDRAEAVDVINNWRSAHAFPLNTFQMLLRDRASKFDKTRTIAQRLKRLPSIEKKLLRFGGMRLTQVQDIGGCRAVMAALSQVERLANLYRSEPLAHTLVSSDDYIQNPDASGYRAVHLIYRYQGKIHSEYNNLLIEIQLRSRLQHAWATAVETVDTFQNQELKFGGGEQAWRRFFALMGSIMAAREKTPGVPGTPQNEAAVLEELRELIVSLDVRRRLESYGAAVEATEDARARSSRWFLMTLEPGATAEQYALTIDGFEEEHFATKAYQDAETRLAAHPGADVVLASVSSLRSLKRAYPNYYLDTHAFLDAMREAAGR